ncbi:MAG: glycosyltransferase family 4 protein [Candidatus Uhrbacteria bacterium]|nr:glycosyltransferase family 4 protein [Candidatus Uhrbacteria bacterium]
MRIFFFITKSEQGGAQTHVAQLTRWLIEHGHDVAVMSQPGRWLEREATRRGAQFLPNPKLSNTANPLQLWRCARFFLHAINDFRPDVVACHSTMAGIIGRLSLRGRIPTIFTAHGWGFQSEAPRLRRWILPLFERLAGRYAKKIICVSRNDLELARTHRIAPDEKLVLVYNGVETFDKAEIASATPRNDTDAKKINILFVGRLAAPKNPGLLVEAFSRLPSELQDKARITIIGDGPDRARLEALIKNLHLTTRVELTGALPREDVLEQLRSQADIFVLLSHWEGFPYSILEAMAVGVPVIASRVGGIPEALEQEGGILIDNDSLEQVTDALSRLITDKALREKMGGMARQTVVSTFSVEQMCKKTFNVYRNAVEAAMKDARP